MLQVFNIGGDSATALDVSIHMPNLRLVNWFDQKKTEPSALNDMVDWRFSDSTTVQNAFVSYIGTKDSNINK